MASAASSLVFSPMRSWGSMPNREIRAADPKRSEALEHGGGDDGRRL